jgi:multiple sugar transport system permease protein
MASQQRIAHRAALTSSIRVDKLSLGTRSAQAVRIVIVVAYAIICLIPIFWMASTAFKSRAEVVSIPPKVVGKPNLEGVISPLTDRSLLSPGRQKALLADKENLPWYRVYMIERGMDVTGASPFVTRLKNSLIIAGASTLAAVVLGTLAAYAFSRFRVPGSGDLLFFILSTRMLPPVVVTIPIFLMYRQVGLHDTHLGLILLYTVFNLSFSVWLMKGFMDEIPREYEEAALVDGYTRLQAFWKVVLPNALSGIAATTVFCLIFAWNEYAFALMLTTEKARTAPPSIVTMLGRGGIEWATIAAGTLVFLIPVVIVTFALRKHLLRGVTFGAIRQ